MRDTIVRAAVDVFAQDGFAGASTHRIAEAAGLKQGHLSYYFKSKDELWQAAVQLLLDADFDQPHPYDLALEQEGENWTLEREMRLYAEFCADRPQLTRIMFHEISGFSPRVSWFAERRLTPSYQRFVKLMGRDPRYSGRMEDAPAVFSLMILGIASSFALAAMVKAVTTVNLEDRKARHRFIDGLMATLFS